MISRVIFAGKDKGFTVDGKTYHSDLHELRMKMSCTAAQARLALAHIGMLDIAKAAIDASGNSDLQIAWEYGTEWKRDDIRIVSLAHSIGLSDSDIDNLFMRAMSL